MAPPAATLFSGSCIQGGKPLGAWIAPQPKLQILALERSISPYGLLFELPDLPNVIDLGAGKTGIIADITGPGDSTPGLWEYQGGST